MSYSVDNLCRTPTTLSSSSSSSGYLYAAERDRIPVGQSIAGNELEHHICSLNKKGGNGLTGYGEEFAVLEQRSDTNYFGDFQEAFRGVNRPKNRYNNVLPLDRTRVIMSSIEGESGSDYINANYVDGIREMQYIAAQGPLKETIYSFWRMVYEEKSNVIVMLTRVIENKKQKCSNYWPSKGNDKVFNDIRVCLKKKKKEHGLLIRYITLIKGESDVRNIIHFQYKEWPDHGLPNNAQTFRHLLHLVDATHDYIGPIVVHCSAGIGRTGTFCTVHTIIQRLENHLKKYKDIEKNPFEFNIFNTVLKLRGDRVGIVQTKEQYEFCYRAVFEEYERQIKRVSAAKKSN